MSLSLNTPPNTPPPHILGNERVEDKEEQKRKQKANKAATEAVSALGAGAGIEIAEEVEAEEEGVYETVFQVHIPGKGRAKILKLLKEYSEVVNKSGALQNCANVSLVYLNIIENPEQYLETCHYREGTQIIEVKHALKHALQAAGIAFDSTYSKNNRYYNLKMKGSTFGNILQTIGNDLQDDYATIIQIMWEGGGSHIVVLLKKGSILFLIDPQKISQTRKTAAYPLRKKLLSTTVRKPREYANKILSIRAFLGPIVPKELTHLIKYDPTHLVTGNLMAVNYEKKFGGTRRQKSKAKKSQKSRRSSR